MHRWLREELHRTEGGPGRAQPVVQGALGECQRAAACAGQLVGDVACPGLQFLVGNAQADQADALASTPLSGTHVSRWYLALARPHSSGQITSAWSPAATPSLVWPSMILAFSAAIDTSASRATAARSTVDGGDDGQLAIHHPLHQLARFAHDAQAGLLAAQHFLDEADLAACRESLALAAHQDHPGAGVLGDARPERGQFAMIGRIAGRQRPSGPEDHVHHAVGVELLLKVTAVAVPAKKARKGINPFTKEASACDSKRRDSRLVRLTCATARP